MHAAEHDVKTIEGVVMPSQRAAKDSRRAQILRAAYHVATRVGLDRLTVRLVAAKARLSSGLVHFYFKTRERLLAALLSDVLKTSAVLPPMPDIARMKSPRTHLRLLLRREITTRSSEPRRVRLFIEFWVKGFRDPLIRTQMRAEFHRHREAFLPTIEALLASEPDRFPQVSAEGLAAVAVGVIEGGAVQSVIDPGNFDVDAYLSATKGLLEQPKKRVP